MVEGRGLHRTIRGRDTGKHWTRFLVVSTFSTPKISSRQGGRGEAHPGGQHVSAGAEANDVSRLGVRRQGVDVLHVRVAVGILPDLPQLQGVQKGCVWSNQMWGKRFQIHSKFVEASTPVEL